jgi:ATP-dependent DNA ligase
MLASKTPAKAVTIAYVSIRQYRHASMSRVASRHKRSSSRFLARVLPGAKPAPFPGFIEPTLATLRTKVPSGAGYVHEVKLDGYRLQAHLNDGHVTLYTRSGLDWTSVFPR